VGVEEGARAVVETSLALKEGEKLLILTDVERELIAQALFTAALPHTRDAMLLKITPRASAGEEPPPPVASLMVDCDAIVLVTTHSMTHTRARRIACRAGARVLSMPGATLEMLAGGSLSADHKEVEEVMGKVHRRLRGARTIRVHTDAGSDLTFSVKGRGWITEDVGVCRRRGECTSLPAGEIFIAPVEGTAEGKLAIDSLLGEGSRGPVKVVVREGYASKIVGAQATVTAMNRYGLEARNLARFGFGLNPRARVEGNPLEDPKALGAVRVAFGDNSSFGGRIRVDFRVDGIILNATVEADDRIVVEKGRLKV
jgi:leucyl aminopeptidase (aminopeptidase T)